MSIALITGSNKGIGKEISRQLVKQGFYVFMTGRDLAKVKQAQEEIDPELNNSMAIQVDVCDEQQIRIAAERISAIKGKVDVLVNNAGIIGSYSGFSTLSSDELEKVISTNALSVFKMIKVFTPLLLKSKTGRIINLSTGMSVLDELNSSYLSYRLSKVMLNALTIMAANELASSGIGVYAVDPGWVKTDMGGSSAPLSVEQGADTVVWLALGGKAESGRLYRRRKKIDF
ncbi:MAG: SDR family NAD(P)-dependent oxidoreductase [Bacteroidia bacterium]